METFILRPNWTNSISRPIVLRIEELRDAGRRAVLKHAFTNPEALRPEKTRQGLTEEAAAEFAELARRLRARGHDPQAVAHFVNRLVFCLFADDAALLPEGLFTRMLEAAAKSPARFEEYARRLFRAMRDPGGEVDFTPTPGSTAASSTPTRPCRWRAPRSASCAAPPAWTGAR
ncbi:type IIL restriction-modification enzyme MmeI [Siccirubricoccus sp. G192]|uniref:type IIL restriction-modification enzyme MmeI n=1 Tax=Siccirubricoccus sp. G192 TaxID=2849651 RepID=UPI0020C433C4|nr:type IIL restriction-modification enzyme MmeI [Siccirubricoccus sp. G192]